LEALELCEDTSLSFLNAGSGTGYLTCIAATILGPRSSHYCKYIFGNERQKCVVVDVLKNIFPSLHFVGIEIHEDVVQHCKESIASWKQAYPPARSIHHIDIIRGNALEVDTDKGECALGFDRIYIGAAIEKHQLPRFQKLLKPGGILVGPGTYSISQPLSSLLGAHLNDLMLVHTVEDELVKVVRIRIPANEAHRESREFVQQVLSGVRFSPLVSHPAIKTVIPALIWNPSIHQYYPDSFRMSSKALLLCSHSNYTQPVKPQPQEQTNVASMVPRALWMEILSYTHRDCK
jgi:protein-L-isoaspartate O-methyltransferase